MYIGIDHIQNGKFSILQKMNPCSALVAIFRTNSQMSFDGSVGNTSMNPKCILMSKSNFRRPFARLELNIVVYLACALREVRKLK